MTHTNFEKAYICTGTSTVNTINACLVLREHKKAKAAACDSIDAQQIESFHFSSFIFIKVATTEINQHVLCVTCHT